MRSDIFGLFLAAAFFLFGGNLYGKAGDFPKVTYGLEWSYVSTIYSYTHINYLDVIGQRVDSRTHSFNYCSNGQILLNVGYNVSRKFNISFNTGYTGIYEKTGMIPFSLRGTLFHGNNPNAGRFFSFIDLGTGLKIKNMKYLSYTGKIGAGYRVSLSRFSKLDFLVSIQNIVTNPLVFEREGNISVEVPDERLRRNNAYIAGITYGIALSF